MHSQVRQWGEEGFLERVIGLLTHKEFNVFLSSDHGNVEATGFGSPKEGALADTKGERVRIYSDGILRSQVFEKFPKSIRWPQIGLPENYFALVAPNRDAFIQNDKRTVAHGGLSLEEVVVPFVHISKKMMPVKEIAQKFALFPFRLYQLSHEIIDNDRIEYARHGLDKEIYILKNQYR